MLLKYVWCVASAFKMTEHVEKWIHIKFCIKLEYPSMETPQIIQKVSAMGSWWLAASSRQHTHITSHAGFFCETSNHPVGSDQLQPRFDALLLLAFLKTKITFEREEISVMRFWKIQQGSWWWLGELVRTQNAWGIIVFCTVFIVSCTFFSKCLFFIIHGWIPSGQTSYTRRSKLSSGKIIAVYMLASFTREEIV